MRTSSGIPRSPASHSPVVNRAAISNSPVINRSLNNMSPSNIPKSPNNKSIPRSSGIPTPSGIPTSSSIPRSQVTRPADHIYEDIGPQTTPPLQSSIPVPSPKPLKKQSILMQELQKKLQGTTVQNSKSESDSESSLSDHVHDTSSNLDDIESKIRADMDANLDDILTDNFYDSQFSDTDSRYVSPV